MLYKAAFAFFFSCALTLLVLPGLGRAARTVGLLDMPGARKTHSIPKPFVGGLGIAAGSFLSCLFLVPSSNLLGFYAGALLLLSAGSVDDLRGLDYRWKLAIQSLAAALMIFFGKTFLISLGDLLSVGPLYLGAAGIPLTIFCIVGVVNAVNMMDGLDGLAGGVALISFFSFAFLAYINNQPRLFILSLALAGAAIGFICYNRYPSRLFLGDGGSLLIGFSMAFLSIAITQKQGSHISPAAALLIVAVPVADALTVILKRCMRGMSPFAADKTHFHHILISLGCGERSAARIIFVVSGVLSITAVLGTVFAAPEAWLFAVFCVFFVIHFVFSLNFRKMLAHNDVPVDAVSSTHLT